MTRARLFAWTVSTTVSLAEAYNECMDIFLGTILTLLIIFVVPIVIYGLFVKFAGLKEPEKKLSFLLGVLVQKLGTALGFTALFVIGKEYFADNWFLYSLVWAGMFSIVEIGQAMGPNYSKKEALAGIISEFMYFPSAAFVLSWLVAR